MGERKRELIRDWTKKWLLHSQLTWTQEASLPSFTEYILPLLGITIWGSVRMNSPMALVWGKNQIHQTSFTCVQRWTHRIKGETVDSLSHGKNKHRSTSVYCITSGNYLIATHEPVFTVWLQVTSERLMFRMKGAFNSLIRCRVKKLVPYGRLQKLIQWKRDNLCWTSHPEKNEKNVNSKVTELVKQLDRVELTRGSKATMYCVEAREERTRESVDDAEKWDHLPFRVFHLQFEWLENSPPISRGRKVLMKVTTWTGAEETHQ